jgi:hypothetical protein
MVWLPAALAAQNPADHPAAACAATNRQEAATIGQYRFQTYQSNDGSCLEALREGKVIFRRTLDTPNGYALGQPANPDSAAAAIANGTDVTGSGHAEMIVTSWTGGAHCCAAHLIFQLEPQFRLLAEIDDENDSWAHFEKLDDGYYYLTHEQVFAYWNTDFADSPMPRVILRFAGNTAKPGFHLALDKMRQNPPDAAEWKNLVAASQATASDQSSSFGDPGPHLWGNMLQLIYSGQANLAWKLLDEAWRKDQQSKVGFIGDFCSQLKTSPYWADLEPTLRNMPAACVNAKPAPAN